MLKIVDMSHLIIKDYLENIENNYIYTCDATCGNGQDSLFILDLIQNHGEIDCFDIQDIAINNTNLLLSEHHYQNFHLFKTSFINLDPLKYNLIVFNLGYLPGGDKTITTKCDDTINIIEKIIKTIETKNDLLLVMSIYPGHEEGNKESMAIDEIIKHLDSTIFMVTKYLNYNRPNSPYLITISHNKNHCR